MRAQGSGLGVAHGDASDTRAATGMAHGACKATQHSLVSLLYTAGALRQLCADQQREHRQQRHRLASVGALKLEKGVKVWFVRSSGTPPRQPYRLYRYMQAVNTDVMHPRVHF